MARTQTRKSISISKNSYDRLKAFCTEEGISMSGVVEVLTKDHLDKKAKAFEPLFAPNELN